MSDNTTTTNENLQAACVSATRTFEQQAEIARPVSTTTDALDGRAGARGPEHNAETVSNHPLADIFPMIGEKEFANLVADIRRQGLLETITVYEDKVLDGRCRYKACKAANVEPRFEIYQGADPLGFVIAQNARRRHLCSSQLALVAARVADLKLGANQHSQGLSIGRAAELMNVSEKSIARAKLVLDHGIPELVAAVDTGKLKVAAAADIAKLDQGEQPNELKNRLSRPKNAKKNSTETPKTLSAMSDGTAATPVAGTDVQQPRSENTSGETDTQEGDPSAAADHGVDQSDAQSPNAGVVVPITRRTSQKKFRKSDRDNLLKALNSLDSGITRVRKRATQNIKDSFRLLGMSWEELIIPADEVGNKAA